MLSIGLRFQSVKDLTGADSTALLIRAHYDLALSATPFAVPALAEFIGSPQIIFGSDYPFVPALNLLFLWDIWPNSRRNAAICFLSSNGRMRSRSCLTCEPDAYPPRCCQTRR